MNICFLIRSLKGGGSARQLRLLARGLAQRGHRVTVFAFYPEEGLSGLEDVDVRFLGKQGRWHLASFFLVARAALRKENPQIVQSYLSAANILSVALKPFLKHARIVWGIRASNMDFKRYDWFHGFTDRIERAVSGLADCIIANSQAGLSFCLRKNFPKQKMQLVPNGIDTAYFTPDHRGGMDVRTAWDVSPQEKLIGIVGRLDPMKDHVNFLQAAAILARKRRDARFVCVGGGTPAYEQQLRSLCSELGLEKLVLWAGTRSDMPQVYSSLDLFTSSSAWGEGFPNVIGEAMACEVPCVVTSVGDSADIVDSCGVIVPPSSPESLSGGWERALEMNKSETGVNSRRRIVNQYDVELMISKTEEIYSRLLEGKT